MRIASADTRRRALVAYEQCGKSQSEIATLLGITLRTFQRWWRAWRSQGRETPGRSPGRPRTFLGSVEERLRRELAERSDATLQELADRMGNIASYVTVHRTLDRWGLPYKKRRSEPQNKTDPT